MFIVLLSYIGGFKSNVNSFGTETRINCGDGLLPVKMAQYAKENGFDVVAISLSNDNYSQLKNIVQKVYSFCPGEVQKIEDALKNEGVKQITFWVKLIKQFCLNVLSLMLEHLIFLKSNSPK